jgi:hypothetical protein
MGASEIVGAGEQQIAALREEIGREGDLRCGSRARST